MITFGTANDVHLKSLPFISRLRFAAFLFAVSALGWRIIITSSVRSFAQQSRLFQANNKNARPGTSTHERGLALDINLIKGAVWLKKETPREVWLASKVPQLAKMLGMKWGGDFVGYSDAVHFELL
jgi:hypothetical protein